MERAGGMGGKVGMGMRRGQGKLAVTSLALTVLGLVWISKQMREMVTRLQADITKDTARASGGMVTLKARTMRARNGLLRDRLRGRASRGLLGVDSKWLLGVYSEVEKLTGSITTTAREKLPTTIWARLRTRGMIGMLLHTKCIGRIVTLVIWTDTLVWIACSSRLNVHPLATSRRSDLTSAVRCERASFKPSVHTNHVTPGDLQHCTINTTLPDALIAKGSDQQLRLHSQMRPCTKVSLTSLCELTYETSHQHG